MFMAFVLIGVSSLFGYFNVGDHNKWFGILNYQWELQRELFSLTEGSDHDSSGVQDEGMGHPLIREDATETGFAPMSNEELPPQNNRDDDASDEEVVQDPDEQQIDEHDENEETTVSRSWRLPWFNREGQRDTRRTSDAPNNTNNSNNSNGNCCCCLSKQKQRWMYTALATFCVAFTVVFNGVQAGLFIKWTRSPFPLDETPEVPAPLQGLMQMGAVIVIVIGMTLSLFWTGLFGLLWPLDTYDGTDEDRQLRQPLLG